MNEHHHNLFMHVDVGGWFLVKAEVAGMRDDEDRFRDLPHERQESIVEKMKQAYFSLLEAAPAGRA